MGFGWHLHRLRAMSLTEVAHRLSEHWKHLGDASFADSLKGIVLSSASEDCPRLAERIFAPEALKKALARDAVALQRGDWELFGWHAAKVGSPPCWHRDARFGVVIPPYKLSHQINHRSLPDGADVRTIWEVNRWSEMTRLAMHAWLNDDPAAIRTAIAWLEDWCEQNPVAFGINWTSPLEAGLRLINFNWFHALVEKFIESSITNTDSLKTELLQLTQLIVPTHAAWVWRYKSFGSSANNHLLGELVGLLHAVRRWPALESLICPAEQLWQDIERCILDQFAEDGGNKEEALHYHLFAWEMSCHAVQLMGIKEGSVVNRLVKAADYFARMTHGEEPWDYGDNDDAQIVPLTLQRNNAAAEWQEWMMGESSNGATALRYWLGEIRHQKSETKNDGWWLATDSGMAVIRQEGWQIRMDASPLGFGKMAAHGHCDALHVSIWDGEYALVIDPGTGGYYGMKDKREKLASWEAHNGPQPLEHFKTPRRMGAFLLVEHHGKPELDQASSRRAQANFKHEGYNYTRRVEVREDGTVRVGDIAADMEPFIVRWHLAPECVVKSQAQNVFHLTRNQRAWRVVFSGEEVSCSIHEGMASRRYGEFETCAVIEVTGKSSTTSSWSRM
jgi:hypothetical protein